MIDMMAMIIVFIKGVFLELNTTARIYSGKMQQMIKHKHTRNGVILRYITGFKVYRKLYINHTLTQAKNAFIEFLEKQRKEITK